jgi:argininosuccinate lyase
VAKLWQKGDNLDSLIEEFTVGNDYLLDENLINADVLGSIAHARVLHKAKILSSKELEQLENVLNEIVILHKKGSFPITISDEDGHTAIENYLVKKLDQVGKKIHTSRSRNDQVQTALRLWMREFAIVMALEVALCATKLFEFAKKWEMSPMPGRTHMQLAMPSSVGLWAASFAEELVDEAIHLNNIASLLDQSPLGSAASYGTPIEVDRELAAKEMGFKKVQNNVLYANNSRGKFEAILIDGCDYVTLTLSKLAQDLLLFSLDEIGYFSLPVELCTGSSIMPQKKNPDALELIRSRSAVVSSSSYKIKEIIRALPSGYNRDFQDTKEPLIVGAKAALLATKVISLTIDKLQVNEENLIKGFKKEIYATDEVLKHIDSELPFRDLYLKVGQNLDKVGSYDPYDVIKERKSVGTSGNLLADIGLDEANKIVKQNQQKLDELSEIYQKLSASTTWLI